MEIDLKTKFYTYEQKNSGGYYSNFEEEGIAEYLIIEALDDIHANARAEDIGIYFDGRKNGKDCTCCGDRWVKVEEEDGDDVPSISGQPLDARVKSNFNEFCFVHYLDGNIEKIEL